MQLQKLNNENFHITYTHLNFYIFVTFINQPKKRQFDFMKPLTIFLSIFTLFAQGTIAQDTIYFDKYDAEVESIKKAESYCIIKPDSLNNKRAQLTKYFRSGKLKARTGLVDENSLLLRERKSGLNFFCFDKAGLTKWMYDGKYKEWYKDGTLKKEIDFKNGKMENNLTTYWPNGKIKRKETFNTNFEILLGECFDDNGKPLPYKPFFRSAAFNPFADGTMQSLIDANFTYPAELIDKNVAGRFQVYSLLDARGKAYKNIIRKGLHPLIDKQILEILSKQPDAAIPASLDEEPSSMILISAFTISCPAITLNLFNHKSGNDTIYYDKDGFIQKSKVKDGSVEVLMTMPKSPNVLVQTLLDKNGFVKSDRTIDRSLSIKKLNGLYKNLNQNAHFSQAMEFSRCRVLNGPTTTYYSNGQIKSKLYFMLNKLQGEQTYYAEDGTLTNKALFENGQLVSGTVPEINIDKATSPNEVFEPQFPGGKEAMERFLMSNVRYPVLAQENRISGKVILAFWVETDGSISDISIARSAGIELDKEAYRIAQLLPEFIPGTVDGVPVRLKVTIPINFNLR